MNNLRVLLIPLDTLDELEIEIKTLKEIPIEQKKQMAVKDYSFFEFMDWVNLSDEFREVSIEQVHCEWYYTGISKSELCRTVLKSIIKGGHNGSVSDTIWATDYGCTLCELMAGEGNISEDEWKQIEDKCMYEEGEE